VTEIKAHPDFILEPWFRSRRVACQIRVLKSVPERESWTVVFAKHGCIVCGTKAKPHASLGMCAPCRARISHWKRDAERPRSDGVEPQTFVFDSEAAARKALADAMRVLLAAAREDDDGRS
jgi:hypothetical protein